jgi:HK97 family phage major capsid protein
MNEKDLKDLRDRRTAALESADAIVQLSETEQRGMTPDENTQVADFLKEADRCKGLLEDADRARNARNAVDEARRQTVPEVARPVADPAPTAQERATHIPTIEVSEPAGRAYQKGDALAAIVSARMRFAGYEKTQAVNWARTTFGENSPQCRALQQSSFTAGGALIPENFVGSEFIELLKAKAKVRSAGARSVQLTNGSFTTPRLTGGVTGYWIAPEGTNVTPSEPTFGQLKLVEKKYMALVPFSNDLRRNASLDAIRIVRDDIVRTAANDEDIAFLKGDGLSGKPQGIYYWVGATRRSNSAGSTLAQIRTDIRTVVNSLDAANAPNERRAWFMHSRPANYLGWEVVDANSNLVFAQMQMQNGALLAGDPVYRDNNISTTLGGGTSTEIYYVEMSECFIGDSLEMEFEIVENAVYADASGTLRSGVSRDESAIRLIRKMDFGMRHAESGYVLEAVSY